MLKTITTNLSYEAYDFLDEVSSFTKQTKRQILEDSLKLYRKYYLEKQIREWFEYRKQEYKQNVKDFEDLQFQILKW